jgi:LEA14-like dessication related protein
MNIDSIICDLTLGGTKLISVSQYVGLEQESGDADSVKFSVNIPISHTRNKIKSLQSQDSTGIKIEAAIVYSGFKIPFVKSQKIEVPVPPRIRLLKTQNIEVKLFKKRASADMSLLLINEGKNLSLDLHDIQYELTVGNDLFTKGKFQKDLSIRPESSQILRFPIAVKIAHPGKTIAKIISDKDRLPFRVKLSGYLDVGKMKRIPVVIFASGKMELVNEVKKKAKKKMKRQQKREERREKREDRKEERAEKKEERKEKRDN